MIETEVAETLMSLSAPDERKFTSPLYRNPMEVPWHTSPSNHPQHHNTRKRSFQLFNVSPAATHTISTTASTTSATTTPSAAASSSLSFLASSLPSNSSSFSLFHRQIHERPLTTLIPDCSMDGEQLSDVGASPHTDGQDEEEDGMNDDLHHRSWASYRSPLDGLCAAARDQAMTACSSQDDDDDDDEDDEDEIEDGEGHLDTQINSSSRPIMIPLHSKQQAASPSSTQSHRHRLHHLLHADNVSARPKQHPPPHHKWVLNRVRENSSYLGQECSPTGVEDDRAWFDSHRSSGEYQRRVRLASICSSDAGSEYGGLGRQHLEEFIRMEISNANERTTSSSSTDVLSSSCPSDMESHKYIGSYSPEARRKRIERFLEKRKRRVWAKKVDYDVRKNFANSRLRVKGRFVKKEDEELLSQMLSFT